MGKWVIKNKKTNDYYCNLLDKKGYWDWFIGEAKSFNSKTELEKELLKLKDSGYNDLVVEYIDSIRQEVLKI